MSQQKTVSIEVAEDWSMFKPEHQPPYVKLDMDDANFFDKLQVILSEYQQPDDDVEA